MAKNPSSPLHHLREDLSGRPAEIVLDEIARAVERARSLVVTAHINPDGDAIGSAVALGLGLRALGKNARVIFSQDFPDRLRELIPSGSLELVRDEGSASGLGPIDLCVLLDTSEPERTGVLKSIFFAPGQPRICLDHHTCHVKGLFDHHLVLARAPACGSLVLALLDELGVPLTKAMAQALWIAVATDTGWFRFENTGPWALHDAARLSALNLDLPFLFRRLYEESTLERSRILGRVLAGLQVELEGRLLWSSVSRSALEAEGLGVVELDGVVDHLKAVRGAQVVALIVETGGNSYKVSLRAPGPIDVERIARGFGGGGHAKAAGYRFSGTLDELVQALVNAVRQQLSAGH